MERGYPKAVVITDGHADMTQARGGAWADHTKGKQRWTNTSHFVCLNVDGRS